MQADLWPVHSKAQPAAGRGGERPELMTPTTKGIFIYPGPPVGSGSRVPKAGGFTYLCPFSSAM